MYFRKNGCTRADKNTIIQALQAADLPVVDLTENEIAKIHIRYMVGGRTDKVANERVYSFEFPERPGALGNFLMAMQSGWNITLFHYRNHGAAEGRVLVGMEATDAKQNPDGLIETLESITYPYAEITNNLGYQRFLK